MPRTKRPVRKQEKSTEDDEPLKKLNKLVTDEKNKIDARAQMEVRNIELAFKILLGSMNEAYLHKTVGQLKAEQDFKESNTPACQSTRPVSQHDDGYLTANSSHGSGGGGGKKYLEVPKSAGRSTFVSRPTTASRSTTASRPTTASRRSRSADASSRKLPPTASKTVQRRRSRSVYRTPAYNKNSVFTYPAITPKVTPQTPLTVLRQPRQGEMVVSMSGSPVMVPSCYALNPDETANCNILLKDGTMLSLQPKHLRQSQAYIPFALMDPNTLSQLKTLKDNIEKVCNLGQEAYK